MEQRGDAAGRRAAALALMKELRRIDVLVGVRNSRIAFDIALLFYEAALGPEPHTLSVDQISATTRYSGPTVRLVLKRLMEAGTVVPDKRIGKTQLYGMSPQGRAAFEGYVEAITAFGEQSAPAAVSAATGPVPARDPPAGQSPPPDRYGDAPPGPSVRTIHGE